jgi:CheY-like chemotaxis protein
MKTILIVDDDVRLLKITRKVLEATGEYKVMTEDSGRRALEAAATLKPDLIILDMNMPGLGGMEFLKEISTPDGMLKYPVLVQTARANLADYFGKVAVDGFVAKPCEPDDLRRQVDRIIALRHTPEPPPVPRQTLGRTKQRVLIGEDDVNVSGRLIEALTGAGYTVDCVTQGPQILEQAVVRKPDAILVKLILSNLNGDTVARLLKDMPTTLKIPVVLYDQEDNSGGNRKFDGPESGVRVYVKSNRTQILLAAVAQVLADGNRQEAK